MELNGPSGQPGSQRKAKVRIEKAHGPQPDHRHRERLRYRLVAIVALMQNSKRFDEIGKRIERVEKQLDVIQSDLKEFFRTLADLDKRIQRLEDHP